MKPKKDSFSIVINGAWNPSIFNPIWLHKHFSGGSEQQIEIAYPLNDPSLPIRVLFNGIIIYASTRRLEIRPKKENIEGMNIALENAKKIVSLLEHTPIGAIGINFGFSEEENSYLITSKINLLDNAFINADEYKLIKTTVSRNFKTEYNWILNLVVSYDMNSVSIDVNFHKEINESDNILEILNKTLIEVLFEKIKLIVNNSYGLEICSEEEE